MSKIDTRNQTVRNILNTLYEKASNEGIEIDESQYRAALDNLFTTTAWGFREILLVVIVAMKLDVTYRASSGLYACNPRAIYEGPIKEFLIDNNIPHRKSGPLNVAKATEGLNAAWAAQRRPIAAAENVVQILAVLESGTPDSIVDDIGVSLIRRLIAETERVEKLNVAIEPSSDPNWLYYVSRELISRTPDAGNTPQKIAALLLWNYHLSMHTGIRVTGGEDRASVTSTTSKKPGDVNEESSATGEIYKVYEITVKPFGLDRIRDSYDCVNTYNVSNGTNLNEIIVICRPEDCPTNINASGLKLYMGHYEYQDIVYYYWNIYEWVSYMLQCMTPIAREGYYHLLNSYISDVNTAESVKTLWRELHD